MTEVNIKISDEAQLLIKKTGIDYTSFIEWFTKERKIWIGGGDVVAYLKHIEGISNEYKRNVSK